MALFRMFKFFTGKIGRNRGGFTLIELLVVIAIIGILASIVLASLNTARRKSRDARRIADIKQIQLALELYFDANSEYAVATSDLIGANACGTGNRCIPAVPIDPIGAAVAYPYKAYTTTTHPPVLADECAAGADTCISYHLGASLEEDTNPALDGDLNEDGNVVFGVDTTDCAGATNSRYCYDVRP
jgi:prepilin-type N-terminal cleavage/methylation domain-containing protein